MMSGSPGSYGSPSSCGSSRSSGNSGSNSSGTEPTSPSYGVMEVSSSGMVSSTVPVVFIKIVVVGSGCKGVNDASTE